MQKTIERVGWWIGIVAICALVVPAFADRAAEDTTTTERTVAPKPNARPGQTGHLYHEEWQGDFPSPAEQKAFNVVSTVPLPEGFLGNMAVDTKTSRVWLVSLGPPTTDAPSRLYQVDAETGEVLRQTDMPFQGDLSSPVYYEGHLYQGVFHESKMYKVSVNDANFGEVVKSIDLPTIEDLNLVDESHPMPFIEFGGVTVAPDGNLVIHADDTGEFIKVARETGEILARTRTLKAIGGIAGATGTDGEFLVLGNSDARGGYCALSYPPALSRGPDQKDISWALLDGDTGEVLASIRRQNSRAYASGIALYSHQAVDGAPYGSFRFLATGEEGLLQIEWTPGQGAY